jgi:hypothetical protein
MQWDCDGMEVLMTIWLLFCAFYDVASLAFLNNGEILIWIYVTGHFVTEISGIIMLSFTDAQLCQPILWSSIMIYLLLMSLIAPLMAFVFLFPLSIAKKITSC